MLPCCVEEGEEGVEEEVEEMWSKDKLVAKIIEAAKAQGLEMVEQWAYILATVEWETNRTFKPVIEAYWMGDWFRGGLEYYPYYGRGYVQLTWKENYEKFERILGLPLVKNPDLALKESVALRILVEGMKLGKFTGKGLERYINAQKVDYTNARKVVNGIDKARSIKAIAIWWEKKLKEEGR